MSLAASLDETVGQRDERRAGRELDSHGLAPDFTDADGVPFGVWTMWQPSSS